MKLLVVDRIATHIFPTLRGMGYCIHYHPGIYANKVLDVVSEYDALIFRSKLKLDKNFFKLPLKLQWIARAGSGIDNIDKHEAMKKGIMIISAGEGNMNAVAEHALGMLLCLINNIHIANQEVKNYLWHREKNRGVELQNLNIGIVGFGKIGQNLANKLLILGCKVFFYDINQYEHEDLIYTDDRFHPSLIKVKNLSDIQNNCHVVSVHTSLNASSRGLFNKSFFSNCKHKIFFINTSRGETVVTKDLLYAIKHDQIRGVALDVLENEKLNVLTEQQKQIYHELFNMPNVLMTPHVAGWTKESYKRISDILLQKIISKKMSLIN